MLGKVPSSTKPTEKECLTPRGHGGGDGIRQNITARKRVPISSARKFNARAPRDESLKVKLEGVLAEMCAEKKEEISKTWTPTRHQKCFLKSASVAEITPTKSKRRLSTASTEESYELFATPRPLNDAPRKKFCRQEQNSCRVYRRLMLLAWRRSRQDARVANDLLKKQDVQVSQLEMQVNVLSKLRVSESQKREETQSECQKLKKAIEILELENSHLNEETQNLQNTLDILQNELKVAKAENNFLSEQSLKMQDIISKKKSEKRSLEEKIKLQDEEISCQKNKISNLEEKLQNTEKNVKTAELNYRLKEKKYAQLKCEFKKQLDTNRSIMKQLQSLEEEKKDISFKVEDLEVQLNDYIRSCEILKDVNDELTQEVQDISLELREEKKRTWLKNTKQFALLSLSALQKVAHVVIPAYLDGPANF